MSQAPIDETKWCDRCIHWVKFLVSPDASHCIHCDGVVRCFKPEEEE